MVGIVVLIQSISVGRPAFAADLLVAAGAVVADGARDVADVARAGVGVGVIGNDVRRLAHCGRWGG